MSTPMVFNIPVDGPAILPSEFLQQAGIVPGDQVVVSIGISGHIYLHKADSLPQGSELKQTLHRLLQQALHQQGYYDRSQIVALIRETRQELANE
ncbi:MAG TPA: hypothetical protein PKE64_27805 [Anaerolineae bacterium]|nr:hypothetical protein [Anaerolineae bacterium]